MVVYLVSLIEDEYADFGIDDVPLKYKKRVIAMLKRNGNEDLTKPGSKIYVGPRPELTLEDLMKPVENKDEN